MLIWIFMFFVVFLLLYVPIVPISPYKLVLCTFIVNLSSDFLYVTQFL